MLLRLSSCVLSHEQDSLKTHLHFVGCRTDCQGPQRYAREYRRNRWRSFGRAAQGRSRFFASPSRLCGKGVSSSPAGHGAASLTHNLGPAPAKLFKQTCPLTTLTASGQNCNLAPLNRASRRIPLFSFTPIIIDAFGQVPLRSPVGMA